ncbi:endonuclease domain-containing protein [Microbacterium invictum]|uniref:Very-short-patch-repair endonuclease n=1 Tax=Microbacterium invictum TaxID=515415 RepID=A0AA40SMN2_9MICO|nr:DUF559 domain-containing protein [Microbacterium invictum]MBB4138942.1 very-short-patch-repair endonuclease [Microbacterium invictum]
MAHSREAHATGYSRHDVAQAVAADALRRIRRSWLAAPGADPDLQLAAAVSGRVTCVTAAKRLGLWVPSHDRLAPPAHVAVPHSRAHIHATGVHLHWATGPIAVAATAVADPVVNVLFHIARCLPRVDALAVWESALRKRAVNADELVRTRWRSTQAAELASVASVLSDSGIETAFVDGMRSVGIAVRQQVQLAGHRVDGLVGDRLVVQIDGFAHHGAADRRRDLRHDALLILRGYTVLRFDYQQVLYDWEHVQSTVLTAVAQGLHLMR